jgi:nucleotide-binding universal stress UspA family protein
MYTDYQGLNREFRQIQWNEAQTRLESLVNSVREKDGLEVESRLVEGNVTVAIGDLLKTESYDLIIMGTLGAGGLAEKLWGSNTGDVIGMCRLPVLAIPHAYRWRKPEKFLLATGNFEKDPAVLDKLFELADMYMAHVDVAVFTDEREEAAEFLDHGRKAPYYGEMLRKTYGDRELRTKQLTGKDLEKSLESYIGENDVDVLTMITYKRGLWNKLLHPSHTKKMSFHTRVPLLAIPAGAEK